MKDPAAIAKYGGTQNQVEFQTVGTERDPSKGGTGISFTQLRDKLKDPNASEQDKLNFWMQAFDSQKLGAEWIKHLMDITAKYSNNKPQAIKEYIAKMRPLLKEATVTQQYKMLKLMKEAYKHTTEDLSRRGFLRGAGAAAALGATALGSQASEVPQSQSSMEPVIIAVVTLEDGTTKTYNLGTKFKSAKEAEQFVSTILDKQGLSYSLDIKRGYPKNVNEKMKMGATIEPIEEENDVMTNVAKDLTKGAPIATLRAARDKERRKKRELDYGRPEAPKFDNYLTVNDYLNEK